MSRKSGGGNTVLLVIVVAVAVLMFLGIVTVKSEDLNDFFNLLRDIWNGATE